MPPMPARPGTRTLLRALGRRLPRTRGALRVAGLDSEIVVDRDRWGIPHVEADSDADAWFALGFCHGQDRSFQLELIARAGRGRLAELLGPGALPIDRLSRTLGFHRLALAQVQTLDADVLDTISAYVSGINAARASSPRPHELVLLRAKPSTWNVEDVLAFDGLQSLALAGNWDTELARLAILDADGPEALEAVEPPYAAWQPVVTPTGGRAGEPLARLAEDLSRLRDLVGAPGGSNAWAVAGPRSASGAPILANDPHLGPAIPPPWYLAHLRAPGWELAGASFVGGPAFATGFNGHAAWGITAACTDSSDLFWEELSADGRTARGPDGPEPVERIVESIPVRGAAAVVEEVLVTRRGPIVTACSSAASLGRSRCERRGSNPCRCAASSGCIGRATSRRSGMRFGRGRVRPSMSSTPTSTAMSAGSWSGPCRADGPRAGCFRSRHGRAVGRRSTFRTTTCRGSSTRRRDSSSRPTMRLAPMTRALPTSAPTGSTAIGRRGSPRSWPTGRAGTWRARWRSRSIPSASRGASCASSSWRPRRTIRSRSCCARGTGRSPRTPRRHRSMSCSSRSSHVQWLGTRLRTDGAGPSAAASARRCRGRRSGRGPSAGSSTGCAPAGASSGSPTPSRWRRRPCVEQHGPDPAGWAWGRVRPLRLVHPLGVRSPLDRLFNVGPVPVGGDANTPSQAGVQPLSPLANPAAIANQRTVIDLGDPERSRFVLAGGQSGNPLSPHYADLFGHWQRGEGVPIAWSRSAVEAARVDRLVLRPA